MRSPRAKPARSRSAAPASSSTLPKRSTRATVARSAPGRASAAGRSGWTMVAGSAGSPRSAGDRPDASRAAAGASTSRPWKVAGASAGRRRQHRARRGPERPRGGPQEPVVRPHQRAAVAQPRGHRPPRGPDAGVDDGQHHRARHQRRQARQHDGAGAHVARRQVVGEVDAVGARGRPPRSRRGGPRRARCPGRSPSAARRPAYGRPASASRAATRPGMVCSPASASTRRPASRALALVTGPIDTTRGPSSPSRARSPSPSRPVKARTVEDAVNVR